MSMASATPLRRRERKIASHAELRNALRCLSDDDRARLRLIAKGRAATIPDMDGEELLQEAICRTIEDRRPWPRDVPLLAFIAGVMRSIASDSRRSPRRKLIVVPLDDDDVRAERAAHASYEGRPDLVIERNELLAAIERQFANDPNVLALVERRERRETAKQLMARTGLDEHCYHAARKRLRRGIDRILAEGS